MANPGGEARAEVLDRIRSSLGRTEAAPGAKGPGSAAATIERAYRVDGDLGREEILDLFVDRLEDYDARVHRVPESGIGAEIARALGDAQLVVAPTALPDAWLEPFLQGESSADDGGRPGAREVLRDGSGEILDIDTLDTVDAVVTGSAVSVADTGTIMLVGDESGRRATTLVPDHHVVVVRAGDVVELVPAAIRRLVDEDLYTRPITMVSGPSATVDIEFVRVAGVHGPRTLDVIIAE